jgi:hypothetical protein
MLAESHRSTETFSVYELQLVKTFLEYNVNSEIPSSRQQTLSLLKKVCLLQMYGVCSAVLQSVSALMWYTLV